MLLSQQIAFQFRAVYSGGNWTDVHLNQQLADINWQQATTKIHSFNTIAALVFHINYYVLAITRVLEGRLIDAHDKYSFDVPPIASEEDWQQLLDKTRNDAETLAKLIEAFPENKLHDIFVNEKYGSYYRNFHGVIEHNHYHLGQIVLLKKFLSQNIGQVTS